MTIDQAFRQRLEFDRLNAPVNVSEQAISEFLIAPVLQEIWRAYSDALMIWSHVQFGSAPAASRLSGLFLSTKRSHLGRVMDEPYVMFIEAKNDDFDAAWRTNAWLQCLQLSR